MKKIIIPTILTATILIAGMFAFMPVEKASAVHTTILSNTMVLKTIRCAETLNMAAANDDGTYALDLPAASSNMQVVDIQLEAGAQTFDADDTLAITTFDADVVTLGEANAATITDVTFDAAPTEGSIEELTLGQPVSVNDVLTMTVDGTATTNTSDYTISFFYMAPSQDGNAVCTPTLA